MKQQNGIYNFSMNIITFTSDFGTKDPYIGIWKGIILSQSSAINIIDISHDIAPANFMETAYVVNSCYHHYPKGTVHLVSVEEKDANSIRYLAMKKDGHFFIAPDNGILTLIRPEYRAEAIHEINIDARESLQPGMQIMSKAAVYLSDDGVISVLGKPCVDPKDIKPRKPFYNETQNILQGHIIFIDRRGNVVTNIDEETFYTAKKERPFSINLPARIRIDKITKSFREINEEAVTFALFNHNGLLEIGVYGGSLLNFTGATHLLGLSLQDKITIEFS
ncbi:MAG: SAM-dependent chlorinase/fluorinase [Cryomorphaceae bacterium]|nr:SAM-dependent chlorinase/fluorinase [Cryomorphaceae bacterium]